MKAYFINPLIRQITRICHDASDYRNIDKAIGCEFFDVVDLCRNTRDGIYVDAEGLDVTKGEFWITLQTPRGPHTQKIVGNGLVIGCDPEGKTCAAEIMLEELQDMVSFDRPEGWVDIKKRHTFTDVL